MVFGLWEKEKETAFDGNDGRRESTFADHRRGSQFDTENEGIVTEDVNKLKRNLHGRHMQMIAIGLVVLFFCIATSPADIHSM